MQHKTEGNSVMAKNFEQFGKENVDATLKSFGAASRSAQAIAVEVADYSKKSFETGNSALEKLLGAKSIDKAIGVQQAYLKDAYEGFVIQARKIGELYADLATQTYKPFQSYLANVTPAK